MKYIIIPEREQENQLPFYFAVEEYVARTYTDDDYFMVWRVEPTVMLGRNQLIDNEVDVEYCKSNGVHIYRRKSGGGCIYADHGCMQFSYISFAENVNRAFVDYMKGVADMLRSLNIDARLSGRNDILVDGKKVAGSAFYRLKGRSVLHNSLLFGTMLDHLSKRTHTLEGETAEQGRGIGEPACHQHWSTHRPEHRGLHGLRQEIHVRR